MIATEPPPSGSAQPAPTHVASWSCSAWRRPPRTSDELSPYPPPVGATMRHPNGGHSTKARSGLPSSRPDRWRLICDVPRVCSPRLGAAPPPIMNKLYFPLRTSMKRDFELTRKILQQFEDKPDSSVVRTPQVEGFADSVVAYHCRLLHDAGFLRCEPVRSSTSERVIDVWPFELTWNGHEFLDKIRSDTTWNKIKQQAKENGLALSFSIISELAARLASHVISSLPL